LEFNLISSLTVKILNLPYNVKRRDVAFEGVSMRNVLFVIALACSLLPVLQCSGIETLSDLNGNVVAVVSPPSRGYTNDALLYSLNSDSLKWLYSCEAGKESQVSLITSGKVQTDSLHFDEDGNVLDTVPAELGKDHLVFSVETYVNDNISVHNVKIDSVDGTFSDTILLATSAVSELILPQSSRMFLAVDVLAVSDTIPLINPHSLNK
jgi:hypothetical protein